MLACVDRVPDELWNEVRDIVQETGIKTIPMEKMHVRGHRRVGRGVVKVGPGGKARRSPDGARDRPARPGGKHSLPRKRLG